MRLYTGTSRGIWRSLELFLHLRPITGGRRSLRCTVAGHVLCGARFGYSLL